MKEKKSKQERRIALAAEYYGMALHHQKQHEYMRAYDYYKKSLQLHDDGDVKKAYLVLLSIIGPL